MMAWKMWRTGLAAGVSLLVAAAVGPARATEAHAATTARPSAANTGVPPGTTLTRHDGNITIANSYVHDLPFWAHDPDQGGKPAHNDGVEIFVGKNLYITNNAFYVASYGNSAMQVNQNLGTVTDLHFTGNYADGGNCTV